MTECPGEPAADDTGAAGAVVPADSTGAPDWLRSSDDPPPDRRRAGRLLGLIAAGLAVAAGLTWGVVLAVDEPRVVTCNSVPDAAPGVETAVHLVAGVDC